MRYHWLIPLTLVLLPALGHAFALASDPAARVTKARASHAAVGIQPIPVSRRSGVSGQVGKPPRESRRRTGVDKPATADPKPGRTFHAR